MNRVAIIVHIFKKDLLWGEIISLQQLKKVLSAYPVIIVAPEGLDISAYKNILGEMILRTIYFHSKHFKDLVTYNRLLSSKEYYEPFIEFDYVLLHHTDAFVFRDELMYWMDKNYDYIGAPAYEYDGTLHPTRFICSGNGGLSLRKVKSFIRYADTFQSIYTYEDLKKDFLLYNWKGRLHRSLYYLTMLTTLGSRMYPGFNYIRENEDVIWGYLIPKANSDFMVAPFEEGFKFSMEFNCDRLFLLNESQLPFGCHGWYKPMFLSFWKSHIENLGYHTE